jgi:ribonuclease G
MKEFIINVGPQETRIALMEDGRLVELAIERDENRSVVGNIYKGKVDSVVPGIQAAFVDVGFEKNGFLYVSDIAEAGGGEDLVFEEGTAKPRQRKRQRRKQSIESMVKRGQPIMVQVSKDMLGTKGVRLTNFVTLPGRFCVLMPTVSNIGISRKIESERERDRLRKILQELRPKNTGVILRTAAEGKKKADFKADIDYLSRLWTKIKSKLESEKSASLIHEDLSPVLRIVRDTFTKEIDKLTVDSEAEYSRILNFLDTFAPNLRKRCKLYRGKTPIFDKTGVEEEIKKALDRKVYLKSGGHICIDQTEALVAIDVNTGRYTGSTHLEETVTKTNMEAAEEIARQVRLRDLGGIIVIDFIDMQYERNRKDLLRKLSDCLKTDRAKTTISEISELGMIEMTRKRVKHNLVKALSQPCPYCGGSGMVLSVTTVTFEALRRLQKIFCQSREKRVIIQTHPDVARRLRNENKDLVDDLAVRFDREVDIESVSDFHIAELRILSARTRQEVAASKQAKE